MALDYKSVSLYIRQGAVNSFCMTGFAAETACKVSRQVGCSTLEARHLPTALELTLDGRGKRLVLLHDENRALGVKVAKHVRSSLHGFGLEMVDAQVEVRKGNRKIGEHDLVMELVAESAGVAGFFSVELKCRRIWSEAGRVVVREALRKECCSECAWWLAEKRQQHWAGRIIVLCEFGRGGDVFKSRADVQIGEQGFRGEPGFRPSAGRGEPIR